MIPDKESIHQLQAVHKACKSIQMEISFTQEQIDCVNRYFHFLYSIGYNKGTRQLNMIKKVLSVDGEGNVLRTFESASKAAEELEVDKSAIRKACAGHHKCKGLTLVWQKYY